MLKHTAARWLAEGRPAVLVTVVDAKGSVPRDAGTRMLVGADVSEGTIGGGQLELQASLTAREMLTMGCIETRRVHQALGPALGQCCGGAVTLTFDALDAAGLAHWPAQPRFHLQLYGAGHVGRAIAHLLATLDVTVDWIDERDEAFIPTPDHIRHVAVDAVEAEVANAPSGAFYLVLTHRHDLDERIAEAILRRGDFAFFGLIGSRTKRQRFIHRFEQRGIASEAIARMTCPIGVPGIVGKEPEVIAIAVVAQMLVHASGLPAETEPRRSHGT